VTVGCIADGPSGSTDAIPKVPPSFSAPIPASQSQPALTTIYQPADTLGERDLALSAVRKLVVDHKSVVSHWLAPHLLAGSLNRLKGKDSAVARSAGCASSLLQVAGDPR
jgi:hypothetical protein